MSQLERTNYYKKLTKRIASMGAAVMMMVSMSAMGASANSYNLHYTEGAPTKDICTSYNTYVSGVFGSVANVYVTSKTFSSLVPGAYVTATNVNSGKSVKITKSNTTYTIKANVTLRGAVLQNKYVLKNYSASKSASATGTDSHS